MHNIENLKPLSCPIITGLEPNPGEVINYREKGRMAERFSILRKKLEELESELRHVFCLPIATPCPPQLVFEDIEQRFAFLNNLVSLELASRPSEPTDLLILAQRLLQFEQDFRVWESLTVSALKRVDDTASRCSCTESCLNDDGETTSDLQSTVYGGGEGPKRVEFFGDLNQEKALQGRCSDCLVEENDRQDSTARADVEMDMKGAGKRWYGFRSLCGVMASGVVLGMGLMGYVMVLFSGSYHFAEPRSFLTPT